MCAAHQSSSFEYLKSALSASEPKRCFRHAGEINGPAEAAAPLRVIRKIKLGEPECSSLQLGRYGLGLELYVTWVLMQFKK